jgi:hypothetical protein
VDTTVSPRIKLFALVGGLGAATLAGGMLLLSRTPATDAAPIPPPAVRVSKAAAAEPKPADTPRAKAKVRAASVVAPNGVPVAVLKQLSDHRVVVVSVYADEASIDTLARGEARAGARDARAGFATVDVSDERIARALAEGSKRLTAPDVLVFRRGDGVVARIHGFADRTLVAQLASSAAR